MSDKFQLVDKDAFGDFLEVLTSLANDPCEMMVRSYSGRGMYGRQCLAVSGNLNEFTLGMEIALAYEKLTNCGEDLVFSSDFIPRVDNLGLGMVMYWPKIEVEPIGDDDEQDRDT